MTTALLASSREGNTNASVSSDESQRDRKAMAMISKGGGKVFAQTFYSEIGLEHAHSMKQRKLIDQVGNFIQLTQSGKMQMLRLLR
jgi:hypothetical protein